ncbi:MAG TPA: pyridoxamine 5'-phosphate oxidase [Arsenicitalea sp.]|jgi:pyridoxamine 5'-phosphate oxidase|nr:pyridoxamine 5'-phosphate oxidase [Arsenicitalea sp.]
MSASSLTDRLYDDADGSPIDPFELFEAWFAEAQTSEPNDPHAMALASVDADGMPDVRMVLMNARDSRGFVFFTNFESTKGKELLAHPKAAFVMHWKSLRRQVRVRGPVEAVSPAEADTYFASRARGSQIASSASEQSRPLASRAELIGRVDALEKQLGDGAVPRPAHWSGFRVVPTSIEFWKDGQFRLHDRVVFDRAAVDAPWSRRRLYP